MNHYFLIEGLAALPHPNPSPELQASAAPREGPLLSLALRVFLTYLARMAVRFASTTTFTPAAAGGFGVRG